MPFASYCINQINAAITARLSDKTSLYFGLCQLMPREGNTIPALVDYTGNGTFSGFDDSKRLIVYHRAYQMTSNDSVGANFGRSKTGVTETIRMRCIVYADRSRFKLNNVDLASIVSSAIKAEISVSDADGLQKASCENITVELDPVNVFLSEYSLPVSEYKVPPGAAYFAVNYSLLIDYDTSCITDCATC